ncbi:unnamed protein product [Dicrocoelium dendriticum]|nr:unnamed protein product [Dicrocoelium dendriticum]CAH8627792.1 unnamed protein product [Dicrocoelium dendriticum]
MSTFLRPASSLLLSRRCYDLHFHKCHVAPKRTRMLLNGLTGLGLVSIVFTALYARENIRKRKEREEIEGPPYYRKFPRDIRLPWGDGKTPFFESMLKYWGIEPLEHHKDKKD